MSMSKSTSQCMIKFNKMAILQEVILRSLSITIRKLQNMYWALPTINNWRPYKMIIILILIININYINCILKK